MFFFSVKPGLKPPLMKHPCRCKRPSVGEVHILVFGRGLMNTAGIVLKNISCLLHRAMYKE